MRINMAFLEAPLTSGRWVPFLVFDAMVTDGEWESTLAQLVAEARRQTGIEAELNVLACLEDGKPVYRGEEGLVRYLMTHGVPNWTHHIEV